MDSSKLYDVRHIKNIKDLMEQSAELFGSKNAFLLKDKGDGYHGVTYSQFKNDMDALGTALLSLGLKDSFIAVIGENRYEWCVSYMAAVNGTGIVVPMDKELPPAEIENLLMRSNAAAVIFSGKLADEIRELSGRLPSVKYLIDMDKDGEDGQKFLSFNKLIGKGKKLLESGDRSFLDAELDAEKMSILLFTSGTTDLAKGVMLSHKNICSNLMSVFRTVYIDSNDSSLSILPLHHTYECTLGFLGFIYRGGTISFNEGLKHIAKNLREVKPTLLISVPLILENMYKKIWEKASKNKGMKTKLKLALGISNMLHAALRIDIRKKLFKTIHDNIGGRVRLIISGAAGIDPEVSKGFRAMGIKVLQGYGLTECSPLAIGNRDNSFKDASVGLPIPGVDVRIENPNEQGIGEIVVKGNNVMLGYYKNEEATSKCLKDRWLYTGDLGYRDKEGFYYITGRSKNVIVTKNGKNIYPEEVEAYINKSPFVEESLVWGRYDEDSGETHVNAQIVPDFNAIKEKLKEVNISKEELMKLMIEVIKNVNKNMPLYKRVREFTIRETEFVKTTTKKIKRYVEKAGRKQ